MMDARRLREITPAKRGWRFVGKWRGRIFRANTPCLVITAAAVTRHYTEGGARKRLQILATCRIPGQAIAWNDAAECWVAIRPQRRRPSEVRNGGRLGR
jgi:hypothetical protein